MGQTKEHERLICGLVVSVLEKRHGDQIKFKEHPDEGERKTKAIDAIWLGKQRPYLLEHTFIESHPKRKLRDAQFMRLLAPLEKDLDQKLGSPGYFFRLTVGMDAIKGAKRTQETQKALKTWICEQKDALQPERTITQIPKGVPFEVILSKHKAHIKLIEGRLLISRIGHGKEILEEQRRMRIRTAFIEKFPKLRAAKERNPRARSVLILESNDLALSNHWLIYEAVKAELEGRTDLPDDIYLIEMEMNEPVVWILKEGKKLFSRIKDPGPHYLKRLN